MAITSYIGNRIATLTNGNGNTYDKMLFSAARLFGSVVRNKRGGKAYALYQLFNNLEFYPTSVAYGACTYKRTIASVLIGAIPHHKRKGKTMKKEIGNRISFITGRHYSPTEPQKITAQILDIQHCNILDCDRYIVAFVDNVRMIENLVSVYEFSQSEILRAYDDCNYCRDREYHNAKTWNLFSELREA
ncbi:MAG: hypothetical protein OEU86_06260 [Gammaproteobacteria bacterium]|nr:hypothetical protein [Gammaproteobacteria bacterium]